MTRLTGDLLDLVLPGSCAGCARPGPALCARCRPYGPPLRVALPANVVPPGPVFAAGWYGGGLRAALLAYKERGRRELVRPLGDLLAGAAAVALTAPLADTVPADVEPVLVPVPSTRAAARARGGDHVLRLARRASRDSGLAVRPALRLTRQVRDSAGLHPAQRWANLAGAFVSEPAGGPVAALVVDDIVTTATTVGEAARALRAAGWPVLGAATVATTPRRR